MKNIILTFCVFLVSFACYGQTPAPITGTASLCPGSTIILHDATTGGTWSSSAISIATVGSISGIVTGIAGGTTNITYSVGIDYSVKTITVNPLPAAISGTLDFCGGIITLTSATSGGTWSISPPSAVLYIMDAAAGSVWGASAGTSSITYTLATGCSASAIVTVEPNPSYITGGGGACEGGIGIINNTVAGGIWSSSNTSVATINSGGGFANISAGTTTFSYTLSDGCNSTLDWTVGVPSPAVSGTPTVCTGFTTTLSDASSGGYWTTDDSSIATVDAGTGVVTGVALGVTAISYFGSSGCPAGITMTVNGAPPIAGAGMVCAGYSSVLTDPGSGGTWSSGNTAIATVGAAAGIVSGIASGTATITYSYGCGITTKTVTVISAISPITGPSNLCIGNTAALNDATPGGIWSSLGPSIATVDLTGHVTGISPGTATINYTIGSGCTTSFMLTVAAGIASHSVNSSPSTSCSASDFYISACGVSTAFNVTTWYGDGTSGNIALTSSGICHADVLHTYSMPGDYSVKQVLYLGTAPQDSVSFDYEYLFCNTLPVKFYFDANHDCTFDSGDVSIALPVLTEVDSNNIPIDTLSATSGLYYKAYGPPGTVYGFRVLSTTGGLHVVCPSTGVLYDTIQSIVNEYHEKDFGFDCMTGGTFDLALNDEIPIAGRHDTWGNILIWNTYCAPVNAAVTVHFSPKYVYTGWAVPHPDDSTATSLTWNISSLSSGDTTPLDILYVVYANPATGLLTAGDTVHTYVTISPTVADIDTTNNWEFIIDTVKASGDPNEMSVMPEGYILPGTQLQYTINFENTGTDTAHNIYVMDTLSDNTDPHSLRIVSATAFMNISILNDGMHNIAKFDFPNINLLDTAAHHKFDGTVIFNIKTRSGLADGTTIFNHAGIFFDYNSVVMTDTVENIISLITGAGGVCTDSNITLSELAEGGVWSSSNSTASISAGIVTGITAGIDTISYTVTNHLGITTTTKEIIINPIPNAGVISGLDSVCAGASIILTESTSGGAWSVSNSLATVASGVITGVTDGLDSILYTVSNACGVASATHLVTINPLPNAGTITGVTSACAGASFALAEDSTGGTWSSSNSFLATVDPSTGLVTSMTSGTDTIDYVRTNSCGIAVASVVLTIDPLPSAITGVTSICEGLSSALSDAGSGTWSSSGTFTATIDEATGEVTGVSGGLTFITYTLGAGCITTAVLTVNPAPGPIAGVISLCTGDSITLSDGTSHGIWASNNVSIAAIDSSSGIVTGLSPGSTIITYTISTGCYTTSVLSINSCPTGVQLLGNDKTIEIYPNPATSELTITSTDKITMITITNLLGQIVSNRNYDARQVQENVGELAPGVYFVKVNGIETGKFVKQ